MVSAPPLRHVHCTPGPSKAAGSSVSRTLGDIERLRYNAFLQKRRLPVPECADTFELEEQHTPGSLPVLHAIFPPGQPAEAVLCDISSVAALFCTTLGTSLLCFFGPPASRQVRGLVTYCGPGTLFLDDQDVDRPGSGFMRFFGEDKQGHAVRRHGAVLQADAGDILLLKGRDYPGNEGRGAVHCSPVASPTSPRMLLVLDDSAQFGDDTD